MNFLKTSFIFLISYILVILAVKQDADKNVCKMSKLNRSNGTQNLNGECVEMVMGEIPNSNNMTSTIILFPKNNDIIEENQPFNISTKTIGLHTGFFDDPKNQYYIFPQTLDDQGLIQGHSHVVIQKIENTEEPLNQKVFVFFKGLNNQAINGELKVLVQNGLKAGICTMASSFGHQPVLMPIAQRGNLYALIVKLKIVYY